MIVVDVTVLSYFIIEGDFTEGVQHVRKKDPVWAAPVLWKTELMNVLWTYMRRGDFGVDLALEHFDLALDLLGVMPVQVLPLALRSNCSAYDCQYVALARQLGVKLITHDKQLLSAFPETAFHPGVFVR